ncbi:YfhD family protein [Amphibacillus jilinensis]|uniref:YfhD family protein n=1 Tax=Amphibacillus jilinensis TaxID=1216008 RepID=UPI00030FB1B4|nr:YfhD family protein [Amphibacillus jilinensis]
MDDKNKHEPNNNKINRNKNDGLDIEFSEELADQEDRQAKARADAADKRAQLRK